MIAPVKLPRVFENRSNIWELRDGIQAWKISRAKLTKKHNATTIKTSCFSKIPPSLIKSAIRTKPKGIKPIKFTIISVIKLLLNLKLFHGRARILFSKTCILDGISRWRFPPEWSSALVPPISSKRYSTKGLSSLANEKL